ncbi:MAG: hypothetical protein LBC44_00480 [Mycoplasmataceae bacterium]|nr:hypothetical protein [Mycoplasmataceae bacterium]
MGRLNKEKRQRVEVYKSDVENLKILQSKLGLKSMNATASYCISFCLEKNEDYSDGKVVEVERIKT